MFFFKVSDSWVSNLEFKLRNAFTVASYLGATPFETYKSRRETSTQNLAASLSEKGVKSSQDFKFIKTFG